MYARKYEEMFRSWTAHPGLLWKFPILKQVGESLGLKLNPTINLEFIRPKRLPISI